MKRRSSLGAGAPAWAGVVAVVALTAAACTVGEDAVVVDTPTAAVTGAPTATASQPTAEPTAVPVPTATPIPTPSPPLGEPDGVIWPTAASQPFGEWHDDPGVAAREFVTSLTGHELPVGEVLVTDEVEMLAEVTLQGLGEDGQPFGEVMRVSLAGGLSPASGDPQWGVVSGSSDRIVIEGWNFIGQPPSFEAQGQGWAFEGTIDVIILDEVNWLWSQGFVMGGGVELAPITGSIPFGPAPAASGFAIFSDVGGLGTPSAMTIVAVSWPDYDDPNAPLESCSASTLDAPSPRPDLPSAVEATRQAVGEAAVTCDIGALVALTDPAGFTFSFGPGDDFGADIRRGEAEGLQPLRLLVELLDLPDSLDAGSAPGLWLWPAAHAKDWSAVTTSERAQLLTLYSEDELALFDELGAYLGYRVGIAGDGSWVFFVAGD